MEREEFLGLYRHSLAHILAKAVIELYGKDVQYAIGPQIEDGFYYDFTLDHNISSDDFETIENKMREILKRKEDWTRKEVSREEALEIFKNQKYKTEIIKDLPDDAVISLYYTGDDYVDLCRGPHVSNSQELLGTAFKIKSCSGAYWRGDEHNDMMQRIYVYAYPSKDELKAHLNLVREAMERDHKKIGPQMDLFMFNETAPGMPYWLPRGWKAYRALIKYWREVHDRNGYQEISAPVINNRKLWLISGHWAHYVNNMFIIPGSNGSIDDIDTMAAKPMNCPNAMLTYKRTIHSYKELPIRYNELDVIHRKEKSGQLNGLFRVQEFRQDDDHTFIMESQIEEEIDNILAIADEIYSTFGITYRAELSTRPDDYMGDIEVWNHAEDSLKRILDKRYGKGGYEINEGDGAFYGPKIDLQIKDALGREWQCGTVQLDFQLPHNFGLTYQDKEGKLEQPVVLHRAIFGSIERFMGILIENYKGAFPFWMSPYQVALVPIKPEHNAFTKALQDKLEDAGIRVEADYADKNMNEKIKYFRKYKDPYTIVIGDKEVESDTVSVTIRGQKQQLHNVPTANFIEACKKLNESRSQDLITEM
ncbi:MAG: threonine--tRNA ligase [Lachnospiraceae bacterium]|jgi:threonyl-tRNA synthetase|nr:threonine--tRNA ligase [Lachnospiraceae bacterium]MDD6667539.1 threonine--tRNA ligase [Lachnospiraceae bacterium]